MHIHFPALGDPKGSTLLALPVFAALVFAIRGWAGAWQQMLLVLMVMLLVMMMTTTTVDGHDGGCRARGR